MPLDIDGGELLSAPGAFDDLAAAFHVALGITVLLLNRTWQLSANSGLKAIVDADRADAKHTTCLSLQPRPHYTLGHRQMVSPAPRVADVDRSL